MNRDRLKQLEIAGTEKIPGSKIRVLVCGGRDFADVARVLDQLAIALVIHGGQIGADTLAGDWAESRGVPVLKIEAEWTRYGGAAGPRRNRRLLVEGKPDLVVAFPGGRGTANMTKQARQAGVEVMVVG